MICEFCFDIEPIAKARPRFHRNNFVYTNDKTRNFEETIAFLARKQLHEKKYSTICMSPVAVSILFNLRRAKTNKKIYPTQKPDIDNLIKSLCDAVNGIVWQDDAQIVDLQATKCYALTENEIGIKMRVQKLI